MGIIEATTESDCYTALEDLGFKLPNVSPPKGAYIPAVRTGNLVYVSGQIPMTDGEVIVMGKVGAEVGLDAAINLSRQCALASLSAIDHIVGLNNVVQVVKVLGFVASTRDFARQAEVVNGASELFVAVFGEAGRHARSSIGVAELPLGAPVEIEVIVEVAP